MPGTFAKTSIRPAALVALLAQLLCAQGVTDGLPHIALGPAPEPIYSASPNDPWNQIFYYLFSRKLPVRLSSDFPEGSPFVKGFGGRKVSSRTFEIYETGDRAIDPLYPTFSVGWGSILVLSDPAYAPFSQALRDALKEDGPRTIRARALMQSDLWGAYDQLFFPFLPDDEKKVGERRKVVLDLIARLIRKIALTPQEIKALPENYSAAARRDSLPDVFAKDSGWLEVAWFLPRTHDDFAEFRRVSRVFMKPLHAPQDVHKFLEAATEKPEDPSSFEGVGLITQLLLIDAHGDMRPTNLTSEAQFRLFGKDPATTATTMRAGEISRKLLLKDPDSGGLVPEGDDAPAYLGDGGSYGFAEGHFMSHEPTTSGPFQVKLRTRCAACHSENLMQIMSFSIVRPPHPPRIRQLNPTSAEVADVDISFKRKRKEFLALREYFK